MYTTGMENRFFYFFLRGLENFLWSWKNFIKVFKCCGSFKMCGGLLRKRILFVELF